MFCQKCGNEIDDNAEFCPKCGTKLTTGNADMNVPDPADDGNVEMGTAVLQDANTAPTPSSSNKEDRIAKIIATVIIVAAVIAIFFVLFGESIFGAVFKKYKFTDDVEVLAAYADDGYGYFLIKNTGDKSIKNFTITVVGYDSDGSVVSLSGKSLQYSYDYEKLNIAPGEIYGTDAYLELEDNVKYIEAIISHIGYKDGTEWKTEGLDEWAKDTAESFSKSEYKEKVDAMGELAAEAEKSPYAEITYTERTEGEDKNSDDLVFGVKNIGDKDIIGYGLVFTVYDKNGYGIDLGEHHYITPNSFSVHNDEFLQKPGEEEEWIGYGWLDQDTESFKITVDYVDFEDGTYWMNDYLIPWMVYNEDLREGE